MTRRITEIARPGSFQVGACLSMAWAMDVFWMSQEERDITISRMLDAPEAWRLAHDMDRMFDYLKEDEVSGPLTEEDHRANAACIKSHQRRDEEIFGC